MKKALIISYYFPPSGGSGVQRPLKFVKYLREFGWEPVVLTAKDADYPAYDESLFSDIPAGVRVVRSKILEPYKLYRTFTGRDAKVATDMAALTPDTSKFSAKDRLAEFIRSAFFVPDARIGWLRFACKTGRQIIREEKIKVIFSTAPPYTTHLIGRKLKRETGIPWVADFRDSWIGWLSTPQWRPGIARRIETRMEESVLRDADKLLTVSVGVKDDLLSRHGNYNDARWVLLPNGFDSSDFENVRQMPKDSRIVITYAGSMYGARNPGTLVRALEEMQGDGVDLESKLLVRIVGRVGDAIANMLDASGVASLFERIDYLPHGDCLGYLMASDYLLLIVDDAPANRGILTGKLFEYIGMVKPVLALAPDGEASELIRGNNFGVVVHPKDIGEIKKVIGKILDGQAVPGFSDGSNRCQFERRSQTAELARVFDTLVQGG